jgi:putative membrane protein
MSGQNVGPSSGATAAKRAVAAIIVLDALTALLFLAALTALSLAKAIHVIAVIAWMAGLLYLPRLFVYHTQAAAGSNTSETFKVMERRLLKAIMNPAMIVTWLAGLWIVWQGGWYMAGWFHAKLLLVIGMSAVHGMLARSRPGLRRGPQRQAAALFPHPQRGADGADGGYRRPRDRQTVLTASHPLGSTCQAV